VSKSLPYAGRIHIYSAPIALTQHIEWAINQHLGQVVKINWVNQPLAAGSKAMEFEWQHLKPIAAQLATSLKAWHYIRFEIREVNKNTQDATYYRATPDLGLHQAQLASNGDVVLNENQVNSILKNSLSYEKLQANLENALGISWDLELEPYRLALATPILDTVSKSG
jgi:plasmid stability protein